MVAIDRDTFGHMAGGVLENPQKVALLGFGELFHEAVASPVGRTMTDMVRNASHDWL
jgi:hypothetical protein